MAIVPPSSNSVSLANDGESGLRADVWEWLEDSVPFRADYRQHRTGEDNGDAHLKSLLVHRKVVVPISGSRLDLGPWQQIFYAEFDGRRSKRLIVKAMGEGIAWGLILTIGTIRAIIKMIVVIKMQWGEFAPDG